MLSVSSLTPINLQKCKENFGKDQLAQNKKYLNYFY